MKLKSPGQPPVGFFFYGLAVVVCWSNKLLLHVPLV